MTERVMNNVKEKLSQSREMCPGLSEEVYALTDYMAEVAHDELVPSGLALCLALSMEDIKRGENGFAGAKSKEIPEYLKNNMIQVLAQAVYVPQVVDAIADEEFANEFRVICKEMLNFDPPKREEKFDLYADIDGDYPEYVKVACNWWANAIANPKFDNGDSSLNSGMAFLLASMVNTKRSISKEQLTVFKRELAEQIVTQMKHFCNEARLSVDYHPDRYLEIAAQKADIDSGLGFPWKTNMHITEQKVTVSAGYCAGWETIWEKAEK